MSEQPVEFDFGQIQENLALRLQRYNEPETTVTREELLQDCKEVYFFHRLGNLTEPPSLTPWKRNRLLAQMHEENPEFTPDILINTQINFDEASKKLTNSDDLTEEEVADILDSVLKQASLDEQIREPHDLEVDIFKDSVNLLDQTGQKLFILGDPRDFAQFLQETILSANPHDQKTKSGIRKDTLTNLAQYIQSQDFSDLPNRAHLLGENEKWEWIEEVYERSERRAEPLFDAIVYWAANHESDLISDVDFPEADPDQRFWIEHYKILVLRDISPVVQILTESINGHKAKLNKMEDLDINKKDITEIINMYERFHTALLSLDSK